MIGSGNLSSVILRMWVWHYKREQIQNGRRSPGEHLMLKLKCSTHRRSVQWLDLLRDFFPP